MERPPHPIGANLDRVQTAKDRHDAKRIGAKPGKDVTLQRQECADTSPIRYTPD